MFQVLTLRLWNIRVDPASDRNTPLYTEAENSVGTAGVVPDLQVVPTGQNHTWSDVSCCLIKGIKD